MEIETVSLETVSQPSLTDELTIEAFRRWLERHQRAFGERHGIGLSASALYCPLSMFLQAQGFSSVSVTYTLVVGTRREVMCSTPPPEWARRFLTMVDQLGGPFTSDAIAWQVRVTTTQALALLDQVEATLGQPFSEWVEQIAGLDGKEFADDVATTHHAG